MNEIRSTGDDKFDSAASEIIRRMKSARASAAQAERSATISLWFSVGTGLIVVAHAVWLVLR